jgi:ABC-type enterobactin transport system permease subunit
MLAWRDEGGPAVVMLVWADGSWAGLFWWPVVSGGLSAAQLVCLAELVVRLSLEHMDMEDAGTTATGCRRWSHAED